MKSKNDKGLYIFSGMDTLLAIHRMAQEETIAMRHSLVIQNEHSWETKT